MTTNIEAISLVEASKLALEALEAIWEGGLDNYPDTAHERVMDAIRQAIEQADQAQPVAKTGKQYIDGLIDALLMPPHSMAVSDLKSLHRNCAYMLHLMASAAPAERTSRPVAEPHKPLTDEQVEKIIKSNMSLQINLAGIRADFEAAHGIMSVPDGKGEA